MLRLLAKDNVTDVQNATGISHPSAWIDVRQLSLAHDATIIGHR